MKDAPELRTVKGRDGQSWEVTLRFPLPRRRESGTGPAPVMVPTIRFMSGDEVRSTEARNHLSLDEFSDAELLRLLHNSTDERAGL